MKDYKKYYIVPASPEEVYKALTIEPTVELWTGANAQMQAEPDTEFSLWDDSIVGKNLVFEENRKLYSSGILVKRMKTPLLLLNCIHINKEHLLN